VREETHKLNFLFHGKRLKDFTLSLGVASFPDNGTNYEILLQAVDNALYHAKNEGRDTVMLAK
jgi:diguanylate cyclase (GGDEF)-like protein